MAEGVKVLSFKRIADETRASNAMALIAAADYEVAFRHMPKDVMFGDAIETFMAKEQIIMTKKTKKSVKETDIRPMIYEMSWTGSTGVYESRLRQQRKFKAGACDGGVCQTYRLFI